MRKSRSPLQWLLLAAFMAFWVWFVNRSPIQKPIPRAPVITSHNSSVASLWVRTDYFIDSSDHTQMIALGNKLFIIGSASDKELPRLIALDMYSGNIIWQYGDANVNVLAISETILFVGQVGQVVALNPNNGTGVWSTSLPFTRSVTKLLVRDNMLYVDTVSGKHFVLDAETGKILQQIVYTIDNTPNPDIPIWSDQNMNLEFVGNIMYFQKQTGYPDYRGEIIAIDEFNRDQIWKSDSLSVITRIAASPLGIFVIDLEGRLLRFDLTEGTKDEVIQFTPPPNPRYYPENEAAWVYGYYVAIDAENQLLFVYLGDSAQLFAFRIQ